MLASYAVLLPSMFDQPFITLLDWMEDHGRRGPPVLLSMRVVELFGFYVDELLTEATLLVRDREPFAGAWFEMACAKLCTTSLFFQPCEMEGVQTPE